MSARSDSPATWKDKALVVLFVAVIALPLAAKLSNLEPAVLHRENRRLARFPTIALTTKSINAFPAAFESYFKDNFSFRGQLIRWHNILKLRMLKVSPSPNVVLGKKGWLFDDDTVAYYRAPPLSLNDLEKWRKFLEEREALVAAQGLPYLLVIAPSSCSIYPEFLPDSVRRGVRETRLDQLIGYMHTHSRVRILDVRAALMKAKSGWRLYNRTDTHWNDLGAYVAYREIMGAVAQQFPGSDALPLSGFEVRGESVPGGDIAQLLALPDLIPEEKLELVPRTPRRAHVAEWFPEGSAPPAAIFMKLDDPSRPRAIVFHDSFTYASLYPFLAEHFSEIWFHWNHYFEPGLKVEVNTRSRGKLQWDPKFFAGGQQGGPVIVIHELAERLLLYDAPPTLAEPSTGNSTQPAGTSSK